MTTREMVWVLYDGDCRLCTRWQLSLYQETFVSQEAQLLTVCGVSQRTPLGEKLVAFSKPYDISKYLEPNKVSQVPMSEVPVPQEGIWICRMVFDEAILFAAYPSLAEALSETPTMPKATPLTEALHDFIACMLDQPAMAGLSHCEAFWGGEGVCWLYSQLHPKTWLTQCQKLAATWAYHAYHMPVLAWGFHGGYRILANLRKRL